MGAFPDFRIWSVRLREGIRWHDGVPVTAHDVKFTLDLLQHPDTLLAESNYTVSALDQRTYSVTYDHQYVFDEGALDDYFACWPKHLLEMLDPKQINAWDFLAASGGLRPVPARAHGARDDDGVRGQPGSRLRQAENRKRNSEIWWNERSAGPAHRRC